MTAITQYLLNKANSYSKNRTKTYIIPTAAGFKFIFINFSLLLIALTYANNLALLINFLMFSYFLIQMLDTHRLIQQYQLKKISVTNQFSSKECIVHCTLDTAPSSNQFTFLQIELHTKKEVLKPFNFKSFHGHHVDFKSTDLKRGYYQINKIKLFTFGPSRLFYVWRYYGQSLSLYIYPKKIPISLPMQKQSSTSSSEETELEYDQHIRYAPGLSFKRIDWKTYAKTEQLYWKRFTPRHGLNYEINYYKITGEKEDKLSKMAYLIELLYKEGNTWNLILPTKQLNAQSTRAHYLKSLEALSEA